jgi:Mg-chelatase subunit ChlD
MHTDSDGDGISDFDETRRFGTDRLNADSDGDLVNDKEDMAEYIFAKNAEGTYVYTPGMAPKTSDFDGDQLRKELDWDNDNDGIPDGCEDVNGNGEYDPPAETSNFNASASQVCQPRFSIVHPMSGQAANAGDPANPDKVLIRLSMVFPPALPVQPAFSKEQFSVTIGGLAAPAISGARVGQEFWLLVQAPGQEESKFYDLAVNFDGTATDHQNQSDSESNAIYYIPRPRMDTVVVFDTSGSMNDDGKLPAAKNAARLYIDQWAENDRVGLVTFADSASVAAPLATVQAGLQVLTDTKDLLTNLTANGLTAMGPGLLLGHQQLATLGDTGHDQTLMLLTDGQENVTPYWSDPTVSGVIVPSKTVVHTIGLGPANAPYFGLLQQIAGATGGSFGAVDDPGFVMAASVESANAASIFPTTTANRLADAYKYAAEQILGEQRLYEATGVVSRENMSDTYRFQVHNVPSLVVTANFEIGNRAKLRVFRPDSSEVAPTDAGVDYRHDLTHNQFRIAAPQAGLWVVQVAWVNVPLAAAPSTEYVFIASGDSPLTMNLIVGETIQTANVGAGRLMFKPVLAIVADHAPVLGATVRAEVLGPFSQSGQPVDLFDDGQHGDGAAGDGIYGNVAGFIENQSNLLKVKATGQDNEGNSFERHAQVMVIGQ